MLVPKSLIRIAIKFKNKKKTEEMSIVLMKSDIQCVVVKSQNICSQYFVATYIHIICFGSNNVLPLAVSIPNNFRPERLLYGNREHSNQGIFF